MQKSDTDTGAHFASSRCHLHRGWCGDGLSPWLNNEGYPHDEWPLRFPSGHWGDCACATWLWYRARQTVQGER